MISITYYVQKGEKGEKGDLAVIERVVANALNPGLHPFEPLAQRPYFANNKHGVDASNRIGEEGRLA